MLNRYPHHNIHQALVKLMIHQVDEAVFLLEKTETRFRNDDWHYLRARCYAKSGELFLALEQMLKIRNHFERRFHSYFFDLIRGLQDDARKVYFLERHPKKHCDRKIQQELIWAYQNLGENEPVIQLYEELIEKHPQIVEIKIEYAYFLYAIESQTLVEKVHDFISLHPHCYKLYLLLIEQALAQHEIGLAHHELMKAFYQFPLVIDVHIKFIEFYLLNHLFIQASLQMRYTMWIFHYSQKVCQAIERLKDQYPELRRPYFLRLHHPVSLPAEIFHGFSLLSNFTNQVYLVGSTVRLLLSGQALGQSQDVDFVSNEEPSAVSAFMKNPHHPKLFNARLQYLNGQQLKIDCYISSYSNHDLMKFDVLNRDFTISAFYCDIRGHVYDPTGMGVYDYYFKILRTIQPAVICFQDDPIRIVRAIKLMLEGFKPCDDLVYALSHWERPTIINDEHLKAVTRKILMSENRLGFIHNLVHLNLFSKLYLLTVRDSLEACLNDLDNYVHRLPPPMISSPSSTLFR